ncbi:aminotransferase class IV [Flavobacterium aquatile]|uniref:branched-chain-amino-acid transaminase n=1 Tax=Flavobacterium aquatile LMG 4008 = ATCC 11947 TaxID=1453498 RepID=A0A095SZ35_9FLAO|nr:aminotransferase class IV [Flavobacterium aquatile]KGD69609.1 aminotransferase class IV [Flavobacterium aquatile LMG 4008 = ATCC 11947]OXA67251.1 aminotransferase class IV [Flavobacterium aquatile LMG 4008 = ATCC 11947]GEC77909.1 aminotransferase class IV [Flavobacterium aquatile]
MINYNGEILPSDNNLSNSNRAFLYGDGVFETLKIVNNKILYLEDHYFRLMASMRIVRMKIPNNFTLEYLETQILNLAKAQNCENSARVRFTVFRNDGGFYLPNNNSVSFQIQVFHLENKLYSFSDANYEVDLYKDFFISKQLLSTIKTTNKMINITGSIFAEENDLQNCILLNNDKNVVEALNGNLFMMMGTKLITPPISEGSLNGIMRKQVLQIAKKIEAIEVIEDVISPFDLQKANELFITNVISGIQPITKYRKKDYKSDLSKEILTSLNSLI